MEDLDVEYRTWRVGGPVTDGRVDVEAATLWLADNRMTIVLVAGAVVVAFLLWRVVIRGRRPRY